MSEKVYPREIKSVYLSTRGDASVGLRGDSATISTQDFLVDLDVFADSDREQVIEAFRAKLIEAFSLIWDEKVSAVYDFECRGDY